MSDTMTGSTQTEDDVIELLLDQHRRVRTLFADVRSATGEHKQHMFDELRALLAVHETAEEMVLRPVARRIAGSLEAEARDEEEAEANEALAELERLDVDSIEFGAKLIAFQQAVEEHARHEELEGFPVIRARCAPEERCAMGRRLRAAERIAPTRAHPHLAGSAAAGWTAGPFVSLLDHARDAFGSQRDH
ncbi:hemerythrin domain-containing protein [Kitasatospora sp. NPDC057015]|uniref:hemerythrin domain-containing protein n=1 Tax=Kitasatospora sp. NPDC057015 TaxID=3346001 RepID=UPI00362CBFCB